MISPAGVAITPNGRYVYTANSGLATSPTGTICEWIPIAPGKSYPLPNKPSEVSRIRFTARTDPGTTTRFIAFLNVIPYTFATVTEELKPFEIDLPGGSYPVGNISLRNLGKSTIYIYGLTTE